ncbi:MAG TPA: two-component regulator propeller domain-containing protein [Planctomycetota bacterium]|nr:two-component regulator propeller domain-containing protein [Planctomycetota bacterium]
MVALRQVVLLLLAAAQASTQELPLRNYGTRDGLPHARVNCFTSDHDGCLWIGTWEGLSRFDGQRFSSYDLHDGLRSALITAICSDASGRLWVGTKGGGLLRLDTPNAAGEPQFVDFELGSERGFAEVDDLAIDARGRLWVATHGGVLVGDSAVAARPTFKTVTTSAGTEPAVLLLPRGEDCAWATLAGVYAVDAGGQVHRLAALAPAGGDGQAALRQDDGSVLLVRRTEVSRIRWQQDAADIEPLLPAEPGIEFTAIARDHAGGLWLGTSKGLRRWRPGALPLPATDVPLHDQWIHALFAGSDGDLWIGTHTAGVDRLLPEAMTSWTRRSGLSQSIVTHVLEDHRGRILVATENDGWAQLDGDTLRMLPGSTVAPFHNVQNRCVCDHLGAFWIGTDQGLYFHPGPDLELRTARRLGPADGVLLDSVFTLYGAPDGRILVADLQGRLLTFVHDDRGIVVQDDRVLTAAGALVTARTIWTAPDGALWLAPFFGLWRLRAGELSAIAPDGIPDPAINARCLLGDPAGRLWIGLRLQGLVRCDQPGAAVPQFHALGAADGLPSSVVWDGAVGLDGALWFGTGRGLLRLDPATGATRTWTSDDGLAGDTVVKVHQDRDGRLWLGTHGGLSRLDPRQSAPQRAAPKVQLRSLRVGGVIVPLLADAASVQAPLELEASAASVGLEFAAVDFRARPSSFRYRLDGDAWSPASEQRAVYLAQLPAGAHRLEVTAIGCDGTASAHSCIVALQVLPPFWRRPWFLALVGAVTAAAAFAVHRLRLRQVVALERVRNQIATDLHDDIGAGLSQIAIVSEVARRRSVDGSATAFGEVAGLARGMRESMADIVWAVDPQRDRPSELVRRLRAFAGDLFAGDGPELAFTAPDDQVIDRLQLLPDARRHWLLLVKEALNNAARHARARHVVVRLEIVRGTLAVLVADDGCGFDPATVAAGHGLRSMRSRAGAVGVQLTVTSAKGQGTALELRPA